MNKKILNKLMFVMGLIITISACDDNIDPLITEIDYARVFSPTGVEARVQNDVNVELNWDEQDSIESYTIEFYADSLEYLEENFVSKVEGILPEQVPYVYEELPGDTLLSVRVKAFSSTGLEASKWQGTTFETDKENIFTTNAIVWKDITLNWTAGASVTHIMYGEDDETIKRELTDEEIAAGSAVLDELEYDASYTATIYNGSFARGTTSFITLPNGTLVGINDDLELAITNANAGDYLLLEGGLHSTNGTITIDKNLGIVGVSSVDRPNLNVQFVVSDGVDNLKIAGIDFNGNYSIDGVSERLDHGLQIKPSDGVALGTILVDNCTFTGHLKSLMSASSGAFSVEALTIINCIVSDIEGNGGDFIDIRKSFIKELSVLNSTFANCSNTARDFFRYDGGSKGNTYDDGVNVPTITFMNNTVYNCSNKDGSTKRFFYVRWVNASEVLISKSNIFSDVPNLVYSNQSSTDIPSFESNYYNNAAKMIDETVNVFDNSGTVEDPDFADPENLDFTVSNANIIYYGIGDPRWR